MLVLKYCKIMLDKNIPVNNLNIPPSESGHNSRFDWINLLHLLTPIALGYVYYKGKKEKEELQHKLETEINYAEKDKSSMIKYNIPDIDQEIFRHKIEKIIVEEDYKAKLTLQELARVENAIKQILDIHCSWIKPKHDRREIEKRLLELSQDDRYKYLQMHHGLHQIFQHDIAHCGGGFNNNGQIYRVWMQLWKYKVENTKQARIALRKNQLYKELKSAK